MKIVDFDFAKNVKDYDLLTERNVILNNIDTSSKEGADQEQINRMVGLNKRSLLKFEIDAPSQKHFLALHLDQMLKVWFDKSW